MNLEVNLNQVIQSWQDQVRQQGISEKSLAVREPAAQQLGLRIAQLALQAMVTASGKGYQGTHLACRCEPGRLGDQRDGMRRVRTLVGEITYLRSCYYCRHCGASYCPLDEQLGQGPRQVSAGVERGLSLLSAHLSFATAAQVMSEIGQVNLSARQVENISEAVGTQATQIEAREIAKVEAVALTPLAVGGKQGEEGTELDCRDGRRPSRIAGRSLARGQVRDHL